MKEKVKASLIQFNADWLQTAKNAERMAELTEIEAKKGAELVLFPELANTGYITPAVPGLQPSYDDKTSLTEFTKKFVKAAEPIPGPTTDSLGQVARKYGIYVVVGMARLHPVIPSTVYNSGVLIGPSGVIGVYDKLHPWGPEKLVFFDGSTIEVYKTDLGNIGISVCRDGRYPELTRVLALKGAEIVCSIYGAFVEAGSMKFDPNTLKYRAHVRALENMNYYLTCCCSGREGETVFMGHSCVAAPGGAIIAATDSLEEVVVTAELYDDEIYKARASGMAVGFAERKPAAYTAIVEPLAPPFCVQSGLPPAPPAPEVSGQA